MDIREEKKHIRKEIAQLKRSYSPEGLNSFSVKALSLLEQTEVFRTAACVALYHAIPGEVQTATFIEKWHRQKKILLPVIVGDELQLLPYMGNESLQIGVFGIQEPKPEIASAALVNEKEIDLIVVPGIAFDRELNRMGRGKGYYDRLLSGLIAKKIGLCFHFQMIDSVPIADFDKKMDLIITDKEVIM